MMAEKPGRPDHLASLLEAMWGSPDESPPDDLAVSPIDVWGPTDDIDGAGSDVPASTVAGRVRTPETPDEDAPRSNAGLTGDRPHPAGDATEAFRSLIATVVGEQAAAVRAELSSALAELRGDLTQRVDLLAAEVSHLQAEVHKAASSPWPVRTGLARYHGFFSRLFTTRRSGAKKAAAETFRGPRT